MKIKIVIGLVALAVNGAMASPRTDYLTEKLRESKTIELQAKSKYLAEQGRYKAATRYRSSLEHELKDVYKREQRQDEQIRKAYRAEYLRVGNINTEDMTAPVSINWGTR
jgi:phosphoenolpyruvate carboxylase